MSISAQELRIGSWVIFDTGNKRYPKQYHVKIKELGENQATVVDPINMDLLLFYGEDSLKPIPLTPEVLLACGFEIMKDPSNKYEQRYHGNADLNFGYPVLYLNKYDYLSQNCSVPNGYLFLKRLRIDCKYLHQLQNLYFALTGKELEYKPK